MEQVLNPPVIEDYFCLKHKVYELENKNKELEQKIQNLEYVIVKTYKSEYKPSMTKRIFSYYENVKIVSFVVIFFFGNKIITDPLFYKCIKFLSRIVF